MPTAGDEFVSTALNDPKCSACESKMVTYRYTGEGQRVVPVKIVTRKITTVELRFSGDPWQPPHWHYQYGDEDVWVSDK
jgi:hypothetical protein